MRVVVDYDLCEANANCVDLVPAVFELDDRDQLHVLVAEPPAELRKALETAVRRCPRQAIKLER